jgi:hypothetical protein
MATLNYKIAPLKQLLFSVTISEDKELDVQPRNNGTLIRVLNLSPRLLDYKNPISAHEFFENDKIKFIDYEFELAILEFGIFDRLSVRLFSDDREYDTSTYTLLTYYSSRPIILSDVLNMVDELEEIYGKDSFGQEKLESHNIDDIKNNEFWAGKSWYFNYEHAPWDSNNEAQQILYNLELLQHPEELGMKLQISGYNNMEKYEFGLT